MAIGKNDWHARQALGRCYDAIPKSVFATLAYRLADRLNGGNDDQAEALAMMRDELQALSLNGIVPERQAALALKALEAA